MFGNSPTMQGDFPALDSSYPGGGTPRRGMFGHRNVGDLISNFLINYSAAQGSPLGLAGVQQRGELQRQQAELKQRELTRQQEQADHFSMFQREHEYTAAHPAPPEPTNLARLMDMAHIDPNSTEGQRLAAQAVRNAADPIQGVPYTDEQGSGIRFVRPGALPGAPPPPPAVGAIEGGHRFLGGNPADPNSWAPVHGGPGQSGPATFR